MEIRHRLLGNSESYRNSLYVLQLIVVVVVVIVLLALVSSNVWKDRRMLRSCSDGSIVKLEQDPENQIVFEVRGRTPWYFYNWYGFNHGNFGLILLGTLSSDPQDYPIDIHRFEPCLWTTGLSSQSLMEPSTIIIEPLPQWPMTHVPMQTRNATGEFIKIASFG